MTTNGSLFPQLAVKMVWGVLISAISVVLLYAGGLEALQSASLVSSLPFTILLLLLMISMLKLLKREPITIRPSEVQHFERVEKEAKKKKRRK